MSFPFLGFGVGLRTKHYPYILQNWPKVDWFEAISENYMVDGGRPLHVLEQVRAHYPVVLHGVSLSIGSSDTLNQDYLKKLKQLIRRFEPAWVSDHFCWTGVGGHNLHDLLPLPYNEATVAHVVARIKQVQDFLGRQILIENVSSYMDYKNSTMSEWDCLAQVVLHADCLILLDINNIYVSAMNHQFDPMDYLRAMPTARVQQFHLAGHKVQEKFLHDTHDHAIRSEVWQLYAEALKLFGPVSTMIERDDHIPPFPELLEELAVAKKYFHGL